jgi:hypothetical protein
LQYLQDQLPYLSLEIRFPFNFPLTRQVISPNLIFFKTLAF